MIKADEVIGKTSIRQNDETMKILFIEFFVIFWIIIFSQT